MKSSRKFLAVALLLSVMAVNATAGETHNPPVVCPPGQVCPTSNPDPTESTDTSATLTSAFLAAINLALSAIS